MAIYIHLLSEGKYLNSISWNDTAWYVKAAYLILRGVSCRWILQKETPICSKGYSIWQLLILFLCIFNIKLHLMPLDLHPAIFQSHRIHKEWAHVRLCEWHNIHLTSKGVQLSSKETYATCFVFHRGIVSLKPKGNIALCSQTFYKNTQMLFMTSTKLMAKHTDRGGLAD
jgi:hypothetical protein